MFFYISYYFLNFCQHDRCKNNISLWSCLLKMLSVGLSSLVPISVFWPFFPHWAVHLFFLCSGFLYIFWISKHLLILFFVCVCKIFFSKFISTFHFYNGVYTSFLWLVGFFFAFFWRGGIYLRKLPNFES